MKPVAANNSFLLVLFLLLYTCAKETDEVTTEPEQDIIKTEKADSKKAWADWQKFNATATNLSAITVTNLKSLSAKSNKAKSKTEKESLAQIYNQSERDYKELKNRLNEANTDFKKDIATYNQQTEKKYITFKNAFLHDIIELNNNLEDIVGEN